MTDSSDQPAPSPLQLRLRGARVPPRFHASTFANFDQGVAAPGAHAKVKEFAERVLQNPAAAGNLMLLGHPGTGKTHLAIAALSMCLEAEIRDVRYVKAMDLIREVRDTWRRTSPVSEMDVLATYGSLRLLVIDEIGVQYGTDGERDVLFDVFDRRYGEMLPTILVSNFTADMLRETLGDRIFDRLRENTVVVTLAGDSYRKIIRDQNR